MDLPAEPAPALARIRAAQQKPVTTQQKPVALQKPVSATTSTATRIVTKPSELKLSPPPTESLLCGFVRPRPHQVAPIHQLE